MQRIEHGDTNYPEVLSNRLGDTAPRCLFALGDAAILRNRFVGLLCSIQCSGSIVIKTFDVIRELRDAGVAVVGGFHLPMERQCLDILLRGSQPVVLYAAKGLPGLRLGTEARRAVTENRLLVISPFDQGARRTTSHKAMQRNDLVAASADTLWVPHAVPGGKTWTTVGHALSRRQAVVTFADKKNSELIEAGAQPLRPDGIREWFPASTAAPA